ncbi:MAG: agmatine deiminase family protein [Bacteroidia bacterium]|nr:agmatine deiminase family protein [Bacteroidia bacterium]
MFDWVKEPYQDEDMSRRMPAEWEAVEAVQIILPNANTDWEYILDEVKQCYADLRRALEKTGVKVVVVGKREDAGELLKNETLIDLPYNDTWARDCSPITVFDQHGIRHLIDFQFNGWGLKFAADKDNLLGRGVYENIFKGEGYEYEAHYETVLEGGSIESDGKGTIMTSVHCLTSPNRNGHTVDEMEDILGKTLGAKRVLWLKHGALSGDDTDGHIDTLARLAPNDTIIYVGAPKDKADPDYQGLVDMKADLESFRTWDEEPFKLVELPFPTRVYDDEGEMLPGTYANYLYVNNYILLPIYGVEEDAEAIKVMQQVFPDKEILAVNCRALIKQHGSLHCVTMQYPKA